MNYVFQSRFNFAEALKRFQLFRRPNLSDTILRVFYKALYKDQAKSTVKVWLLKCIENVFKQFFPMLIE